MNRFEQDLDELLGALARCTITGAVAFVEAKEAFIRKYSPANTIVLPREPTSEIIECFVAYNGIQYTHPFTPEEFKEDYQSMVKAVDNSDIYV